MPTTSLRAHPIAAGLALLFSRNPNDPLRPISAKVSSEVPWGVVPRQSDQMATYHIVPPE